MDALSILREDARRLSPAAARAAQFYVINHTCLTDLWRSALVRTLDGVAAGAPAPLVETLLMHYGWPGAWQPCAYTLGDAMEVRLWLTRVQTISDAHGGIPMTTSL